MNEPNTPSAAFLAAFAERAGESGALRYDAFVDLALYHPALGYYSRPRDRVGYGPGTDFFTSSTSGPVFGELVVAACVKLLGNRRPEDHVFVEVGAEPGGGILTGVTHPFKDARVLALGETLDLSGPCVVFSNELFDAQPFRRFRFDGSSWHELGVRAAGNSLSEVVLSAHPAPEDLPDQLPQVACRGYTIDAPIGASLLARVIARQPWTGLFVGFDYGKTWQELVEACPAGTARAYHRHTQTNALLDRPGEQDLTCHICWDWLGAELQHNGFASAQVESQESFFIRHAEAYLAAAIAADATRLTARKQSLMQLLHGSQLGQKFQVLHAVRDNAS